MNAFPVANHVLWRANKDAIDITPMKLQKMMYFLHGWYMAITDQKLIDEGFTRWQYGPVVPSVYRELKHYGGMPIDDYIKQYDSNSGQYVPYFVNTNSLPQFDSILEQVWNQYSRLTAIQLSTLTHEFGSPWYMTEPNDEIRDDLIRNDFVRRAFPNNFMTYA
jgi:uncharacterized phage-associated protein